MAKQYEHLQEFECSPVVLIFGRTCAKITVGEIYCGDCACPQEILPVPTDFTELGVPVIAITTPSHNEPAYKPQPIIEITRPSHHEPACKPQPVIAITRPSHHKPQWESQSHVQRACKFVWDESNHKIIEKKFGGSFEALLTYLKEDGEFSNANPQGSERLSLDTIGIQLRNASGRNSGPKTKIVDFVKEGNKAVYSCLMGKTTKVRKRVLRSTKQTRREKKRFRIASPTLSPSVGFDENEPNMFDDLLHLDLPNDVDFSLLVRETMFDLQYEYDSYMTNERDYLEESAHHKWFGLRHK